MYLVYLGVFDSISAFFFSRNTPLYLGFEIQRVFGLRDTVQYNQIRLNTPQILIAQVTKRLEIRRNTDETHFGYHTASRPDTLKYTQTVSRYVRAGFTRYAQIQ